MVPNTAISIQLASFIVKGSFCISANVAIKNPHPVLQDKGTFNKFKSVKMEEKEANCNPGSFHSACMANRTMA